MTRLFRDLYNDARIYCFEPNVKIVKFLKKVDDNSSYLKIKNFISGKKKKSHLTNVKVVTLNSF